MAALIDSSLWIDFIRSRSPRALKQFIAAYVLSPDAAVAEPIVFEVLRHALDDEIPAVSAQLNAMPMLQTPEDLWARAATVGQRCRKKGITAGSIDLLIVTVAIHNNAELVTFDVDFQAIAKSCDLRIKLLQRPH